MACQAHVIGAARVILYRAWNHIIDTQVLQSTVSGAVPLRRQRELEINGVWAVASQTIPDEVGRHQRHVTGEVTRLGW